MTVQELRARVSIVDLATHYGYEHQHKKGRHRPVLVHPHYKDTIIIKNPQQPDRQVYQQAGDFTDAGTIIDFIRYRLNTVFASTHRSTESEFKTIIGILCSFLQIEPGLGLSGQPRTVPPKSTASAAKRPFDILAFDLRPLQEDNYLQQRNINQATLNRPEFIGKVVSQIAYFDIQAGRAVDFETAKVQPERTYRQFVNVAFPYYDSVTTAVTGLEIRNDKVKLHASGSDRLASVFISNPPAKVSQFFILESAIDALSHCQLRQFKGQQLFDSVYFSTGGQLTAQQVSTIGRYIDMLPKEDRWILNLAFDNDVNGNGYDLLVVQHLIAHSLPLVPIRTAGHRLAYELPQQPIYLPILEVLRERIDAFIAKVSPLDIIQQQADCEQKPIVVYRQGKKWLLNISKTCEPLAAVSQMLLTATGLDHRVKIIKSLEKDFNQELSTLIRTGVIS